MSTPRRSAPRVYELTLRLSDVEPVVWRRLRVSSGATLARATRVFAIAMGWSPGRPYAYSVGTLRYESAGHRAESRNGKEAPEPRDGTQTVRLRQLLPDAGRELEFEYGHGHAWHFTVRLDRLLPPNDELRTPFCVDGGGGAPPLDVGGPWGYEEWRTGEPVTSGAHPQVADIDGVERHHVTVRFNPDVVNAEFEQTR